MCKGGKFTNVYIGYGMKRFDSCFNPTSPPTIDFEPVDAVEQPEPTPLTEPVLAAASVDVVPEDE